MLALYADFRGRARRGDIVTFFVALMGLAFVLVLAGVGLSVPIESERIGGLIFNIVVLFPMVALFVRRLHDQGRSGRWLIIGIPGLAFNFVDLSLQIVLKEDYFAAEHQSGYRAFLIITGMSTLALMVMMFLPEQEGPNRFGPDPRCGEPEQAR